MELSPEVTVVVVHGGVSGVTRDEVASLAHALTDATSADSALEAVELSVRALEDDPMLNAGWGSVLNSEGALELDAGIADGDSGRWAGVTGVSVRHPISLARRVLERSPHVLVTARGAAALAEGMERLGDTTPEQRRRWEQARVEGRLTPERYAAAEHVDTVGAVALDARGRLAAGSSTGGVFGKMPGRVGDAPVFGAGLYASARAAAVGTGVGELFLETLCCARAGRLIEDGLDPQAACEAVIASLRARSPATTGILALDADGRVGAAYRGGSWAVEGARGRITAARLE